jgi:hypothetical protein
MKRRKKKKKNRVETCWSWTQLGFIWVCLDFFMDWPPQSASFTIRVQASVVQVSSSERQNENMLQPTTSFLSQRMFLTISFFFSHINKFSFIGASTVVEVYVSFVWFFLQCFVSHIEDLYFNNKKFIRIYFVLKILVIFKI